MAEMSGGCSADGDAHRNDDSKHVALEPKHKIFLSHSGAQKQFVGYLCHELERCHRYPFFDLLEESLPIGESFPSHIFRAINQCYVGVVILSEEFLTSKWPMMELVAMVEEAKKRKDFTVIPVFLGISLVDLENVGNWKRWRECWRDLALKNSGRVVVEDWEAALKYIRPLNSLVKKGEQDHKFLNEIVDKVCRVAPLEVKLEDSHMEGRSRLCKVIQDKIEISLQNTSMGVCVVGLYGVGGMGKTTLCKALCNKFFDKFRGRVCHAELERVSEDALLRDVLKRLSKTREDVLNGLNESEMRNGLRKGNFIKDPVFLALDNMSNSRTCIKEAKGYLSAKLPVGSIVLVTSRYKESLVHLMRNMDESKCMRMPELEFEEAMSLLVKSSEGRIKDDKELVERFVERCCFHDDGSERSYHFHPSALEEVGMELAEVDDLVEFEAKLGMDVGTVLHQNTKAKKWKSLQELAPKQGVNLEGEFQDTKAMRRKSVQKPASKRGDNLEGEFQDTKAKKRKSMQKLAPKQGDNLEGEFQCDMEGCIMAFNSIRDLQLHKKNLCTWKGCGKHFHMHKYLLQHRRVHLDDRPLKCPWKGCTQAFKWAFARTEHIRVHTGERPYKCLVSGCGQTFLFISDFSRHKRNTGHRPT